MNDHAERYASNHPDTDLYSLRCHPDQQSEIARRIKEAFAAGLKLGLELGAVSADPHPHPHHPPHHQHVKSVGIEWTEVPPNH